MNKRRKDSVFNLQRHLGDKENSVFKVSMGEGLVSQGSNHLQLLMC